MARTAYARTVSCHPPARHRTGVHRAALGRERRGPVPLRVLRRPRTPNTTPAPAGRASGSRSSRLRSASTRIAPGSCGGPRFVARAAMPTSVTCFRMVRSRPECATARTAPRCNSSRTRAQPSPDAAAFPAGRSGVAAEIVPQLVERAEPQRALRQFGLDRSVGIERVGHAVDDPGFQDRCRLRSGG